MDMCMHISIRKDSSFFLGKKQRRTDMGRTRVGESCSTPIGVGPFMDILPRVSPGAIHIEPSLRVRAHRFGERMSWADACSNDSSSQFPAKKPRGCQTIPSGSCGSGSTSCRDGVLPTHCESLVLRLGPDILSGRSLALPSLFSYCYETRRPWPSQYFSRSSRLRTLPLAFRGRMSIKSTEVGHL